MGIFSELIKKFRKNFNIVTIGLDASGKTSIMNFLKRASAEETVPTVMFEKSSFQIDGKIIFQIFDMGGQTEYRNLWKEKIEETDAIIFVIDVNNEARYEEAKMEFYKSIENLGGLKKAEKQNVPILIALNKIDLVQQNEITKRKERIYAMFELQKLIENGIKIAIQPTCALNGYGLVDMMKWIYIQTTGKNLNEKISAESFIIYMEGGIKIYNNIKKNSDKMEGNIENLLCIINSCLKMMSGKNSDSIEMKVDGKTYILQNSNDNKITGVIILDYETNDTIDIKTKLKDLMKRISHINFDKMEEETKKAVIEIANSAITSN